MKLEEIIDAIYKLNIEDLQIISSISIKLYDDACFLEHQDKKELKDGKS